MDNLTKVRVFLEEASALLHNPNVRSQVYNLSPSEMDEALAALDMLRLNV